MKRTVEEHICAVQSRIGDRATDHSIHPTIERYPLFAIIKSVFPNNLRHMPLKRRGEPFSHRDWLFELKHDGFRALAFVENGTCRLISRNGNVFSSFDVLCATIPEELNCTNAVLDGEIVVLDAGGRSQFNELLFRRGEPRFYAFDLLWRAGKDLRFDGRYERKRKLRSVIRKDGARLLYCDHIEEQGEFLFRFACENDLEGVVAKPRNSPYLVKDQETSWLKIQNLHYTQALGRDELFAPAERKVPQPLWAR